MPKKPQIQKKKKSTGLTQAQFEHLTLGYNMLSEPVPWHFRLDFPFPDEATRKRLYFENRDQLLRKCDPDRPSGFWDYEAKEHRRVIAGDPSKCMWERGSWMGKCRVVDISGPNDPERPIFESQAAFLKRHGLKNGE